jgi:hypothetical protein
MKIINKYLLATVALAALIRETPATFTISINNDPKVQSDRQPYPGA